MPAGVLLFPGFVGVPVLPSFLPHPADRCQHIPDGEYFKAQKYTADYLLNEQGCNIDLCGYPHEEEEVLDPLDTIREYQERRATLNAEIDKVLAELEALLPGGVKE